MTASERTDECTETKVASFRVCHAITELEIAAKRLLILDEAHAITTKGVEVFLATRKEMGDNFKRVISEELTASINRLSAVKKRMEII